MKQKKLITCLFFLFATQHVFLQKEHVIASAGTNLSEANVKLSFTLGETFTPTLKMSETKITQGFQQPHQQPLSSASTHNNFNLKVYPNPTTDFIVIENPENKEGAYFYLYNESGQILQSAGMQGNFQKLDLTGLPAGNYLLQTTYQNQSFTTTIIKSSTF
jgi:hypothetical protein